MEPEMKKGQSKHDHIKEAVFTPMDQRKMVRNSSVHPYNGLGKLITVVADPLTKQKRVKSGTAFLVAKNLIMTAAHNLYQIE
jgi:V8-like Glu-specific endopeptidase